MGVQGTLARRKCLLDRGKGDITTLTAQCADAKTPHARIADCKSAPQHGLRGRRFPRLRSRGPIEAPRRFPLQGLLAPARATCSPNPRRAGLQLGLGVRTGGGMLRAAGDTPFKLIGGMDPDRCAAGTRAATDLRPAPAGPARTACSRVSAGSSSPPR